METNFFLTYDLLSRSLWHNGVAIDRFEHRTCSGEHLIFECREHELRWSTPFLLLDNIFYIQVGGKVYFGRHLDQFRDLVEPDLEANTLLRQHGFLPHARTQLKGVEIVCSYLEYTLGSDGVKLTSCFPWRHNAQKYSVDDLMDVFRDAFRKQLERVNRESWVLPLSGGMDSRMLLSLALEHKDIDLNLFTLGTRRSGDIKVASAISQSLGLAERHKILYLEDITRCDVLSNYRACDYLLPLDRILNIPLGNFFKPSVVLSGLYGDVIFADNVPHNTSYSEYFKSEGFKKFDSFDDQIVQAYDGLPEMPKLQRMALRCQKLTRQSFPISPGFDFVTPFVDPQVVLVASNIRTTRIYQNLVSRHMRSDLQKFIHQSTMSYFTHANWLRVFERKFLKLLRHPARAPYYDTAYLKSIGVMPNEAPILE
jgi:hypothetical protein